MSVRRINCAKVGPAASPRFLVGVPSGPPPKHLVVRTSAARNNARGCLSSFSPYGKPNFGRGEGPRMRGESNQSTNGLTAPTHYITAAAHTPSPQGRGQGEGKGNTRIHFREQKTYRLSPPPSSQPSPSGRRSQRRMRLDCLRDSIRNLLHPSLGSKIIFSLYHG